jgi:hypothetical protein
MGGVVITMFCDVPFMMVAQPESITAAMATIPIERCMWVPHPLNDGSMRLAILQ